MENTKNVTTQAKPIHLILIAVTAAVLLAVYLFLPGMEHIADTNGPDDTSLAVLTEADILGSQLTSTGTLSRKTGRINLPGGLVLDNGVEFSSKEFSGVTDLLWTSYLLPSDFQVALNCFQIDGGNFRMMVVNNDQIIADIQPGDNIECLIENLTGPTSLRIAAESASVTIIIPTHIYDLFEHD